MKTDSDTPRRAIPWMLSGLAVIALVAGLAMGLMALAAPLGVWFSLWDFRQSFSLLRTANAWGYWVALSTFAIVLVVFATARFLRLKNAYRLGIISLIGFLSSALAYYIPESYRPPEGSNIPPIHDITTDTANPPRFIAVLALRADAPNSVIYGKDNDLTAAGLAQLQREAYPDIVPYRIDAPKKVVFDEALRAVQQLGWDLVAEDPVTGRIEATDTTFWFRFKDDVVIVIEEVGDQTLVNARSLSRLGRGDAGKNASRLREFFALLDENLKGN